VNRDFGRIFSTLLPGATAKLAPPEGKSVLEGLEFKVNMMLLLQSIAVSNFTRAF
jgi:chromosome segregation ATPase